MTTALMILQKNRRQRYKRKLDFEEWPVLSICAKCGERPCLPVWLFCQCEEKTIYCVTCILEIGYASSKGFLQNGVVRYVSGKVQCPQCNTVDYPTQEFVKPVCNPDQEMYNCPFEQCTDIGPYLAIYRHVLPAADVDKDISCAFEMLECPSCQHVPAHPKCKRRFQRRIPEFVTPRIIRYQAHVVIGGCTHISCNLCNTAGEYEEVRTCNLAHFRLPAQIQQLGVVIHTVWRQFVSIPQCINGTLQLTTPTEDFLQQIQQLRQIISPWDLPPMNIHLMTIQDKLVLVMFGLSCLTAYTPYAGELEQHLRIYRQTLESFLKCDECQSYQSCPSCQVDHDWV